MGVEEDHLAVPRVSAFNAAVQNAGQESSWGLRKLAGGREKRGERPKERHPEGASYERCMIYDLLAGVVFIQVQLDSVGPRSELHPVNLRISVQVLFFVRIYFVI